MTREEWLQRNGSVLALAVLSVIEAVLLWTWGDLPMVDLPQHEAQLAILQRLSDPEFAFADLYQTRWFHPYLLAYLIVGAFGAVVGVHAGARCLITLAAIGLPWAHWLLLRKLEGDRWWAVLACPLAFGFAFSSGFLGNMLALPLLLLCLWAAYGWSEEPGWRWGAALTGLSLLLWATHLLFWGVAVAMAGWIVIRAAEGLRPRLVGGALVASPTPLAVIYMAQTFTQEADTATTQWGLGPERLLQLFDLLGADPWARAAGLGLLLAVAAGAKTLSRDSARWGPLVGALLLFLFAPWRGFGAGNLYPRFAVLAALLLPLALTPLPAGRRRLGARAGLVALALLWPAVLWPRFATFDAEAKAVRALGTKIPADARLYAWVPDPSLPPLVGDVCLHLPTVIQVEQGTLVEPSFAHSFISPVSYKPGAVPAFNWDNPLAEALDGPHTFLLVRSPADPTPAVPALFERGPYRPVDRQGDWWLFRR